MKQQKNLAANAASAFRLQFRISTILLLIAAVTIWVCVGKPDGWWKFRWVSQKIKQRKQLPIDQALEITTKQFMVRKTTAPRSWSPSKIPSAGIKVSIRQKGSYGKIE